MKKTVVFTVLYGAFFIGAIATGLFGRAGVGSYRTLSSYAVSLRQNLDELEALNGRLSEQLELLRSDRSSIRVLARQLGYLERGEHRVILPTYAPAPKSYPVGHVQLAQPEPAWNGLRLETLYLIPLLVLFIAFCIDSARTRGDG